jgi:hypothetical protein
MVEAAGYQHGLAAVRLERGDERARALDRVDALGKTGVDGALVESGQQPDPLAQRALEVELKGELAHNSFCFQSVWLVESVTKWRFPFIATIGLHQGATAPKIYS